MSKDRRNSKTGAVAAKAKSGDLDSYFARARQFLVSGDLNSAAQIYQSILSIAPTDATALHYLGVIMHQAGRTDLACEMLTAAIEHGPGAAEIHLSLGCVLEASGRPNDAVTSYKAALSIDPQYSDAYYNMGNCLFNLGDVLGAIASYDKAISINDRNPDTHYNRGFALQSLERYSDAINSFHNALRLKPDYVTAASNIGFCLFALGKPDDALAAYKRTLQINPNHPDAIFNMGTVLLGQGDLDSAIDAFNKALQLRSDWKQATQNLGLAYKLKGRYDDALRVYQRALSLQHDCVETLNHLASLHALQDDTDVATSYFMKSLTIDPDKIETYSMICTTLQRIEMKDQNKSRNIANYIAEQFPEKSILHRSIAGFLDESFTVAVDIDYTTELFDSSAGHFDKTLAKLAYDIPEKLAAEIRHLRGGENRQYDILDAGCGTGLSGIHVKPIARNLIGVDLSEQMLSLAEARGIYDRLEKQEIISHFRSNADRYDIIISADVLIYIGDLVSFSEAAYTALHSGGLCAVSAEAILDDGASDGGYRISKGGRYQHTETYLRDMFSAAGFSILTLKPTQVRFEFNEPVPGWLLIAEKRL